MEIELGIFFFRYYDVFLCADHIYVKIKKSMSILMDSLFGLDFIMQMAKLGKQ